MEDQANFLLDWTYFCHGKSVEELNGSLLITTMELEASRFKAEQELKQKDDELIQLKHVLNVAINEKLEAQNRYHTLVQRLKLAQTVSSVEDDLDLDLDHNTNGGFSSSDYEESIVSSPVGEPPVRFTPPPTNVVEWELGFPVKALPENGKFLEAVIKAGPLLQNLLIAGPLPHWQHPPPPLDSYQIPPPPVNGLLGKFNKKRGFPESSDSSTDTKYQRYRFKGRFKRRVS